MEKKTHKKKQKALNKNKSVKKRPTKTNRSRKRTVDASKSQAFKKKKLKKKKLKKKKRGLNKVKVLFFELLISLIVTTGILYVLSLFLFTFAKIEGYSMSDTLDDGEIVFVSKISKVKRFDLVYIHVPNSKDTSIRRIIGKPGEELYYKNGQLFINEEEKPEHFISDYKNQFEKDGMLFTEDFTLKSLTGKPRIPRGKYLVLGDNRPYATDSRYYQLVDEKEIIGKVTLRIFPIHLYKTF